MHPDCRAALLESVATNSWLTADSTSAFTFSSYRRLRVRRVGIGIGRLAGIVWVAYFGLSATGLALKILPLSLAANAVYFVVAVVLFQFLASADPLIAVALLPL